MRFFDLSHRLLTEEDKVRIYYNVENARVYRSAGPNYIEITAEVRCGHLLTKYCNGFLSYAVMSCAALLSLVDSSYNQRKTGTALTLILHFTCAVFRKPRQHPQGAIRSAAAGPLQT